MAGGWAAKTIAEGANSAEAITLIQDAFSAGLLMTSICGGAHLFAAADIINGTSLTAYDDLAPVIEAAGGTYVDTSLVIDEPFVTAQAGFHIQLVNAIADVLGDYEEAPPSFVDITVEQLGDKQYNITVETADESPVYSVSVMLYIISDDNQKTFIKIVILEETSDEFTFSGIISMTQDGIYSLDVSMRDWFGNYAVEADVVEIDTEINMNKTSTNFVITLVCIFCIAGFIIVRRRHEKL